MEGEQNNADVGSKGMCYKTPYNETEMNAAGLGLHPLWRSCCGLCCGGCRNLLRFIRFLARAAPRRGFLSKAVFYLTKSKKFR